MYGVERKREFMARLFYEVMQIAYGFNEVLCVFYTGINSDLPAF